jgi:WD40 repeat protein
VAIQQRNSAQRETVLAESRALASGARNTASTQLDLALLLAERSVQMNPTPDAFASLFSAVSVSPHLVQFIKQPSPVTTLIARPDGGMLVGDAQGTVSLLDTAHARQQPLPAAGSGAITALADSGLGRIVVSGDVKGTVRLWSLSSRSLRWQRAFGSPVQAIAVSPDASTIAAVLQNDTLVDLDAVNGRMRYRVALGDTNSGQHQDNVSFLQNDIVLVGDGTGATQVWRMAPQPQRLRESGQQTPADQPVPTAWSSDGRTYVYAVGGTATVIHAATGQAHGSFDLLPATTTTVAIDDSTNRLAYISNGLLAVEDRSAAASKAQRTSMQLPGFAKAQQAAFTADGRWLIAGGGDTLAIFDLQQRSRLATELPTEVAPLACQICFTSLAVDPRGRLVVWTDGPDIVCYDVRRARQRRYRNANPYSHGKVAFTPDGFTLLSYSYAGTVSNTYAPMSYVGIWPTPAGCPSSVRWIRADNYSPGDLVPVDRNRVVITSFYPSRIGLLDLRREKIVRMYSVPDRSAEPSSTAVSSDGRSLAVSLTTGKIIWFDVNSGAVIGMNGSESGAGGYITFLPGSQDVAQTTLTAVVLWDPRRGQVGRFEGSGSAQKLAFSHDGQLLFALDNQDNLHIWDTAHQTLIGSLQALPLINENGNPVAGGEEYGYRTSMAIDDNNNLWLAAPSAHPTRWTLSPPMWSKFACAWAGRTLTDGEWRQYVATTPPADLACRY